MAGLAQRGAHAGRSVILLPYAQLMPVAARQWALRHPDGFAPRFETSRNWAHRLAAFKTTIGYYDPYPQDSAYRAFDSAVDIVTPGPRLRSRLIRFISRSRKSTSKPPRCWHTGRTKERRWSTR
mgnify:CR=1 FL=1